MDVLITGLGTALVTPFTASPTIDSSDRNRVDYHALAFLIERQIKAGVSFLVPCGTTGESPTLTTREHQHIIGYTIKIANGQVPVVAGTGSNCTREAVELTEFAKQAGAKAALVVSPYYNKPMPNGFIDYYTRVGSVGLPIILYDIPGRTAKGVPTDVIIKLANDGVIAGIKWASGDLNQLMEIKQALPGFKIFSGDDNLTYSAMRLGADGVISVLSNIIPGRIFQFIAYLKNPVYWDTAQKNHYELLDLMKAMFIQTNPIPVKTALAIMYPEIFANEFRSPMTPITNIDDIERLFKALDDHDIIKTSYQETLTLLGMHKNSSESVDN